MNASPRVAVVGHIEWVRFGDVAHMPRAGEVLHARGLLEEPAGGGGVAAVQLARLAGASTLVTALGDDEPGRRARLRLGELGVDVRAALAEQPTRTAVTLIDGDGERAIVTFGPRLDPLGADLGDALAGVDAVYFTAGDVEALRLARREARVLVASPRARTALGHDVTLDALVLSDEDAIEQRAAARALDEAELVVWTEGQRGGRYRTRAGREGRWAAAAPPGPRADSYGCGDSFAAGLTYALGAGLELGGALALAARCGAVCLTGHGPYERQLTGAQL